MVALDECDSVPALFMGGSGLVVRLIGRKLSSRTLTKFEGKTPIARLSRCKRPIHHDPSPALRHSIKSPSMNPKSRFDSPPQEYVARHQHGKREGRLGATCAIADHKWFDYINVSKLLRP